jgi:hypothetical protein
MGTLRTRAIPTLATALVLSACQDATSPLAPGTHPDLNSSSDSETRCVGTLPPGTYENIVVPENTACFVDNSVVRGNVKVLEGAALFVFTTFVGGSVQGDKAALVQVIECEVVGNVEIKEGGAPDVSAVVGGLVHGNVVVEKVANGTAFFLGGTEVHGNVKVEDNVAAVFTVTDLQVGQDLQVFKNRGPGEKEVVGNTVDGNLQCFENDPPFLGGPNAAQQAEGQCF